MTDPTTFEDLVTCIRNALDRDGKYDWDETARLAEEVIAPKVWNELRLFPIEGAEARPDWRLNGQKPDMGRVTDDKAHAIGEASFAPVDAETVIRVFREALTRSDQPTQSDISVAWEAVREALWVYRSAIIEQVSLGSAIIEQVSLGTFPTDNLARELADQLSKEGDTDANE